MRQGILHSWGGSLLSSSLEARAGFERGRGRDSSSSSFFFWLFRSWARIREGEIGGSFTPFLFFIFSLLGFDEEGDRWDRGDREGGRDPHQSTAEPSSFLQFLFPSAWTDSNGGGRLGSWWGWAVRERRGLPSLIAKLGRTEGMGARETRSLQRTERLR